MQDVTEADIAAFGRTQALRARSAASMARLSSAARRPAARAALRLQLSDEAAGPDVQRAIDWRAARRHDDFSAQVAAAKPRPTPHVQMNARHVVRDGRLVLEDFLFVMAEGILGRLKPDPWVVPLLMQFDGTRSVGEVYAAAQAGKTLPGGFRLTDFADLVSVMLERGFLDADAPRAN